MPSPSRFSGASTAQATAPPSRDIPGQKSTSPIFAIEHIRRMRGGAQAQLMRCSDGRYYVVKFLNNPQSPRVLANELLGGRLARLLGLPVATGSIVNVHDVLIQLTQDLTIELPRERIPCQSGWCFGSRYQGIVRCHSNENDLPTWELRRVTNLRDFCGMLVFDLWTCNTDSRQVIFIRKDRKALDSPYHAVMIDQGFCFNAGGWNFPDSPLRGLYRRPVVYENVRFMNAFEPWLTRLEQMDLDVISTAAEGLPSSWYGSDKDSLKFLLERLYRRRTRIQDLILSARNSDRNPFPNWSRWTYSAENHCLPKEIRNESEKGE